MPGAGTKATGTVTEGKGLVLDLTRLLSRVGRGPWTGIDRTERAYLDAVLAHGAPAFGLVRTASGHALLDHDGLAALRDRLDGRQPWGDPDLAGRFSRRISPERQAAESYVRRLALGTAPRFGFGRLLRRVPAGSAYINVGHSNLDPAGLGALGEAGLRRVVMVHDTIPLDHPEYQRPGTPARFAEKLQAVSELADLVICNSEVTRSDFRRHAEAFGRVPETVVAPLGVTVAAPDASLLQGSAVPEAPYVVTVGTIEPRKNHALLLDVWDSFVTDPPPGPIPQLFIVGQRGWENEAVFQRLDALGPLSPYVHEMPDLPDAAVSALVASARAAVFPSLAEGYGLPPLEALALGTPVLCAPLPVYRETLGDMGVYASAHDVYVWRNNILDLVGAKRADLAERERRADLPALPSWDGHFNVVFSVMW